MGPIPCVQRELGGARIGFGSGYPSRVGRDGWQVRYGKSEEQVSRARKEVVGWIEGCRVEFCGKSLRCGQRKEPEQKRALRDVLDPHASAGASS